MPSKMADATADDHRNHPQALDVQTLAVKKPSPSVLLRLRFRTTRSVCSSRGRPLSPTPVDPISPPGAPAISIKTSALAPGSRRAITANRPSRPGSTIPGAGSKCRVARKLDSKQACMPVRDHLPLAALDLDHGVIHSGSDRRRGRANPRQWSHQSCQSSPQSGSCAACATLHRANGVLCSPDTTPMVRARPQRGSGGPRADRLAARRAAQLGVLWVHRRAFLVKTSW